MSVESGPEAARILLVDDEVPILELLTEILVPEGYQLSTAQDGADALEMIEANDYDLIISDFRMPRMTGRELYDAAVASQPGIERRFLFITGEMDPFTKTEFINETGVKVISKPFRGDEVRKTVAVALTSKS